MVLVDSPDVATLCDSRLGAVGKEEGKRGTKRFSYYIEKESFVFVVGSFETEGNCQMLCCGKFKTACFIFIMLKY